MLYLSAEKIASLIKLPDLHWCSVKCLGCVPHVFVWNRHIEMLVFAVCLLRDGRNTTCKAVVKFILSFVFSLRLGFSMPLTNMWISWCYLNVSMLKSLCAYVSSKDVFSLTLRRNVRMPFTAAVLESPCYGSSNSLILFEIVMQFLIWSVKSLQIIFHY